MTLQDHLTRLRVRIAQLSQAATVAELDKAAFLALGALQDVAAMKRKQIENKKPNHD